MHYNLSLKLIESLKGFIARTYVEENDSTFYDFIEFIFPFSPLPMGKEFGSAVIEVAADKDPIKVKLDVTSLLNADEKLETNIKNKFKCLLEKYAIANHGDLFKTMTFIDKLKHANFEIDKNERIIYLTADLNIQDALKDLPTENVREIVFAKATKLNDTFCDLIKISKLSDD